MAASGTAFLLSGPQLAADRLVDCDLSSFTASHFYVQHRTQQAGDGRRKARRKQRVPFASILISKSFDLLDARPPMDELTSGAFPDFLVGQVGGFANSTKHVLAGALSAVSTKTLLAPLERIKLEMQFTQCRDSVAIAAEIWAERGPASFWKGNGLNCLRTAPHKAINFYAFNAYRKFTKRLAQDRNLLGIDRFIAGALAGSTATLLCYPLDVMRTRIMTEGAPKYAGPFSTLRTILSAEGPSALYVGCTPAVISTAASGAIFYGVYDLLKDRYFRGQELRGVKVRDLQLSAARTLAYGALAGVAAEGMLYPLEVLRRRMQTQSMQSSGLMVEARAAERMALSAATERGAFVDIVAALRGTNGKLPSTHRLAANILESPSLARVSQAAIHIYKMDGLAGFYAGVAPHLLQVLPGAALSFWAYELFKRVLSVED